MARTPTEAINSYITDMLSLEEHIQKAITAQLEDFKDDHPQVTQELRGFTGQIQSHMSTLKGLADARQAAGGGVAEAIKRAGSTVAGLGAAAIDLVRTEKLPKNLRDDYTAFSLATVGYLMLNTTALSLNDQETAQIASRFLRDYARMTMTLQHIIPAATIRFLREDGLPARDEVLQEVEQNLRTAWTEQSGSVPNVNEMRSSQL
jgi:hypothetical protein